MLKARVLWGLCGMVALVAFGGLLTAVAAAPSRASVSVTEDGEVVIKSAVVFQVIGPTFIVRTNWGQMYIRWIVRTDKDTRILRRWSGTANLGEIKQGDVLDIEGTLLPGADTLNIVAKTIRNVSLDNEDNNLLSGKVLSVEAAAGRFSVASREKGTAVVQLSTSTVMMKGLLALPLEKLAPGDIILSAVGDYHFPTKTLRAREVAVYQDSSVFKPRNFQGKLKSLYSTSLPTSMTVTIENENKDYVLYLSEKTEVWNKRRQPTSLNRFVLGDTVRFYGAIRETDLSAVDAQVVRNLDL